MKLPGQFRTATREYTAGDLEIATSGRIRLPANAREVASERDAYNRVTRIVAEVRIPRRLMRAYPRPAACRANTHPMRRGRA